MEKPKETERPKVPGKKRGGKGGGKKGGKNKPVQPTPEPEKPTPEPEKPKPQPEKPKGPLDDLPKVVKLPALAEVAVSAGQPVALSPVHLGPDASMQVVLLSGERTAKLLRVSRCGPPTRRARSTTGPLPRNPRTIWRAAKGRTWRGCRSRKTRSASNGSPAAAAAQGNSLRNCGLLLSVGNEKRFLPLRVPKEVEPLVVNVDHGPPRKGINERPLAARNCRSQRRCGCKFLAWMGFPNTSCGRSAPAARRPTCSPPAAKWR